MNKTEDLYARVKDGKWMYTKSGNAFIDGFERMYRLKVKLCEDSWKVFDEGFPLEIGQYIVSDEGDLYKIYRIMHEPYISISQHLEDMKRLLKSCPPPEKFMR